MDLNEFVKEALLQITSGVRSAQAEARSLGGMVNPATLSRTDAGGAYFSSTNDGQHIFLVDFDVAVSVAETGEKGGEAKLKVASILSIGGGASQSSSSTSTNRITFKVPLALPVDPESHAKLKAEIQQREADRQQSMRQHNPGGADSWMA